MTQKIYLIRVNKQWAQVRRASQKPKIIRTAVVVPGRFGEEKLSSVWHEGGRIVFSLSTAAANGVLSALMEKPLRKHEVREVPAKFLWCVRTMRKKGDL